MRKNSFIFRFPSLAALLHLSPLLPLLLSTSPHAQPHPPILWSFTTTYPITTSPAVAPDGTIYLGTAGQLCAITNAGSNKWTFPAGPGGLPAIGADGTIYFGAAAGTFYALNPDGSQKWSF